MRKLFVLLIFSMLMFVPTTQARQGGSCELFGQHVDGRSLWIGDCGPVIPATNTPSSPKDTPLPPTAVPTLTPMPGAPYAAAPACEHPNNTEFHMLWNSAQGCHYDHEHGTDPFTAEVAAAFPDFDLQALLGDVQIGHTNPSSPAENTVKHGGFKWNVQLTHPEGCAGFESATNGVSASVIEYHGMGDYEMELEAEIHSTAALLEICNSADPENVGYLYTVQHQNYGQIVVPYQGDIMIYPYYSVPLYPSPRGQYISVGCIGTKLAGQLGDCRDNLAQAQRNAASSGWTSKITGSGARPEGSTLFTILWRVRDIYKLFDWSDPDLAYPHKFLWLCTSDGGSTFSPAGCEYNNTTTQVGEIAGVIPAAWDALDGAADGHVTYEGYTTRFGALNPACLAPGPNCHPIKMVNVLVGSYGSVLVYTSGKGTNIVPVNPERDIYFDGQPSGWLGEGN